MWFKVETVSGVSIYISSDNCLRVRPNTGKHGDHAKSLIDFVDGLQQPAMATPEEVMAGMSRSGG
jgi:hypothetical protein